MFPIFGFLVKMQICFQCKQVVNKRLFLVERKPKQAGNVPSIQKIDPTQNIPAQKYELNNPENTGNFPQKTFLLKHG